ncbi:MAG: hypothetical protein ACLFRT_14980 [Actinomycetota bacterium]
MKVGDRVEVDLDWAAHVECFVGADGIEHVPVVGELDGEDVDVDDVVAVQVLVP